MISLRSYNKDIEKLIDDGQYTESIAHCRYILEKFPKCIDTYRNLGKTLLELKNYPEALDIFSRVLSAFPDDFISHIGLSIIFEDQNDLDLAIWHMEQAFDVQPSNLAIQDELKRLFGRRDGEQPVKIRLTRGALVRMYARGELYQQAISEINSILQEDPRRIDLEVILAKMNYLSGSINEAFLICTHIVDRIPFCFEANRILQEIYLLQKENEEALVCQNRLISLDPYYRFVESPLIDQEIPDEKIMLEKLSYIPSDVINSQAPVWVNTVDDQWNDSQPVRDDWIQDLSSIKDSPAFIDKSQKSEVQNIDTTENSVNESNVKLPDWMQEAGWSSVSNTLDDRLSKKEETPFFEDADLSKETILPDQEQFHTSTSKDSTVNEIHAHEKIEKTADNDEINDDLASLFSELKEGKMDEDVSKTDGEQKDRISSSDWMSQFSDSEINNVSENESQEIPDWLKNFNNDDKADDAAKDESEDMPDWLRNLHNEVEPVSQSEDVPSLNGSETTTIETELSNTESNNKDASPLDHEETENQIVTPSDGWEKVDLTEQTGSEPDVFGDNIIPTNQEDAADSEDKIPDWVKSVLLANNETSDENMGDTTQTGPLQQNDEKTSDSFEPGSNESETGVISQQTNDELLSWLRNLKNEDENRGAESSELNIQDSTASAIADESDTNTLERLQDYGAMQSPVESESPQPQDFESITQPTPSAELDFEVDALSSTTAENDVEAEKFSVSEKSEDIFPISSETKNDGSKIHQKENLDTLTEENHVENDTIAEVIASKNYDRLPAIVKQLLAEGNEFEKLVQSIVSTTGEQTKDYEFWQSLGDVYAHENKLKDALSSYQKAEDILTKNK